MWGEMRVFQMYNGIKYIFDFDVAEGGTSKR